MKNKCKKPGEVLSTWNTVPSPSMLLGGRMMKAEMHGAGQLPLSASKL